MGIHNECVYVVTEMSILGHFECKMTLYAPNDHVNRSIPRYLRENICIPY